MGISLLPNEVENSIWITLKAFSTTCNVYLSRINLNIAITDMVDRKSSGLNDAICRQAGNETDFSKRDVSINPNVTSSNVDDIPEEKFTWTNKQQGLMLGLVIHWLWIEVISAILNNASISGFTFSKVLNHLKADIFTVIQLWCHLVDIYRPKLVSETLLRFAWLARA